MRSISLSSAPTVSSSASSFSLRSLGRASNFSGSLGSPSMMGAMATPVSVFTTATSRLLARSCTSETARSSRPFRRSTNWRSRVRYSSLAKAARRETRSSTTTAAMSRAKRPPRPGGSSRALGRWGLAKSCTYTQSDGVGARAASGSSTWARTVCLPTPVGPMAKRL